jgi:vancomycin resistance protein YoaR
MSTPPRSSANYPPDPRLTLPPAQPSRRNSLTPWLIRLPLLAVTAVILLFFLGALYVAFLQLQYDRLIYPGVSAYGTALGGLTREQAIAALSANYTYSDSTVFTFRDGERTWQKNAADLGVTFDPARTIDEAYKVGRGSGLINNLLTQADIWVNGRSLQPVIVFDETRATIILDQIAAEINRPVLDAALALRGTTVTSSPAQVGRQLDTGATLGLLRPVILNLGGGGEIELIVRETQPTLPSVDEAAKQIQAAVSAPITLFIATGGVGDPGPWQASPEFIAGLLRVARIDNGNGTFAYTVSADPEPLRAFLNDLASKLVVEAVPARFVYNDQNRQLGVLQDSVDGRGLDIEGTLSAFRAAIFRTENRTVPLSFTVVVPTVNSRASAEELGIRELVVEATTYFYGSSAERRTNIQVASARFHGIVIAPNETFSFNKYLGDVSPETGFETGLVIFGDRTIQGVGGGVCQVSTTIFQGAFFGGFRVDERYPHGYRVGYYESGLTIANGQRFKGGVGLDATVYSPLVDFRFTNDTPYHLLLEAYFNPSKQSLTFKFYSTSMGRTVTVEGPTLGNVVAHGAPKYTESATMKSGQQLQVDYAVDGVDARVYRTVREGDRITINNEEFYSHYLPWSAQILVAPGQAPRR